MMKELPTLSEIYCILLQKLVHQDIGNYEDSNVQNSVMAHRVEKRKYTDLKDKNSGG